MNLCSFCNAVYVRLLGAVAALRGHWTHNRLIFEMHLGMGLRPLGTFVMGKYEASELAMLKRILRHDDRVLEIGSGMGFLALNAAKIVGYSSVFCVEANPDILSIARKNSQVNRMPVVFYHGVVSGTTGTARFRKHKQFWRSAVTHSTDRGADVIDVPKLSWYKLWCEAKPTVVIIDIEGGEIELTDFWILAGVRAIIVELHPRIVGESQTKTFSDQIERLGFAQDAQSGNVVLFLKKYAAL